MGPSSSRSDIQRSLEERVTVVAYATMAYWYYRWDWGESVALDGLARFRHIPGVETFLVNEMDRWVKENAVGRINRFGPARCVVARYRESPDDEHASFLRRLAQEYAEAPRRDRVVLLEPPSEVIYVDTLYGEPALLVELSRLFGDESLQGLAVDLALGHARHLQDEESGLMAHFRDLSQKDGPRIPWGRGNGWAALGLAELLVTLPNVADGYPELLNRFQRLCLQLVERQAAGGGWRNLIDEPASYPESSATLLIAAAMNLGTRAGVLDPSCAQAASSAWAAFEHRVDTSGHVIGVSYRPGVNSDPARYEHTPVVGMYPWGQGPYLIAASQAIAASEGDT